ncbi:MAG: hypothetical protein E7632_05995, partial [Ruminococcaceae bacterium]|nr:hypothetical protein [Oscillospiraceae bacterium]
MKLKQIFAGAMAALLLMTTACGGDGVDFAPSAEDKKIVMTVGGEKVEHQEYRYFYLNNKRDLYGEDASLTAE